VATNDGSLQTVETVVSVLAGSGVGFLLDGRRSPLCGPPRVAHGGGRT
jgi:hypothetical protein